jgi:thiazole synthase ThiGH ThiG subunit
MTTTNRLTEAEQIAETFGVVLGAASHCEQVTEERLNAVAAKVKNVVLARAHDDADAEAASDRFSAAVEAGRTVAESGRIDPDVAENAFSEMEERLTT